MKIAILGTKGIPNNYGGYEQFAEFISRRLVEQGHSVTVYNPHYHRFTEEYFHGVRIIRKFSPERFIGGAANILYDHLCLKDALKRNFDIIYEAGYHSVALSYKLLKVKRLTKPVIITNMDGLEWRRSKWSHSVQNIIKVLEQIAVDHSPYLIADNEGIRKYLKDKFGVDSFYLPYGADPVETFDLSGLEAYDVLPNKYFILVARLEPENNIEIIIESHIQSQTKYPLIVIGNHATKYGKFLKQKYHDAAVRFVGGLYNKPQLDALRHYSLAYFHGHSVGGTNPSLLEAMASQSFIIAHDNPFNGAILGDAAFYFKDVNQAAALISQIEHLRDAHYTTFLQQNLLKIKTLYNWDEVVRQHANLFENILSNISQRILV